MCFFSFFVIDVSFYACKSNEIFSTRQEFERKNRKLTDNLVIMFFGSKSVKLLFSLCYLGYSL